MLQLQLDSICEEKARGPFERTMRKWLEEGIRTQNTSSVWEKRNVEISALFKIFASLYIDIRVDDAAFFLSIKPNAKVNIKLCEINLGICVIENKNISYQLNFLPRLTAPAHNTLRHLSKFRHMRVVATRQG